MIQVFRPQFDVEATLNAFRPVLEKGWVGQGPKCVELEAMLSARFNAGCAVVSSCTAALHLAVKLLRLPPGSFVATTPISFVSTNHALLYERLKPVWVDIEPRTGNMDAASLEETVIRMGGNISAIMVVHIGGYPCDMNKINEIAAAAGIPVIEDCAHAFGSVYEDGHPVGDSINMCCFSFHAVKNLGIGDGGAVVSKGLAGIDWIRKMRWMGIDYDTYSRTSSSGYKWEYNVDECGYKYNMNDVMATIAIEQLKKTKQENERRRQIANMYAKELKTVFLPLYDYKRKSSHHFYPVFHRDRDALVDYLAAKGISCGMHYRRNDKYACYQTAHLPNAEYYEQREVTLPMHCALTDEDVARIIDEVNLQQ